jgi:hypothetical protein
LGRCGAARLRFVQGLRPRTTPGPRETEVARRRIARWREPCSCGVPRHRLKPAAKSARSTSFGGCEESLVHKQYWIGPALQAWCQPPDQGGSSCIFSRRIHPVAGLGQLRGGTRAGSGTRALALVQSGGAQRRSAPADGARNHRRANALPLHGPDPALGFGP